MQQNIGPQKRRFQAAHLGSADPGPTPSMGSRTTSRLARYLGALTLVLLALLPAGTAAAAEIFNDGFEGGNLNAWAVNTGAGGTATAQTSLVHTGTYAARLTATTNNGAYAYARKSLSPARANLTVTGWFNLQTEGAPSANVPFFRLYGPDGTRAVSVFRQNLNADRLYVQHNDTFFNTTGALALNRWAQIQVTLTGGGTSGAVLEVFLNGTSIYRGTAALPK
jgi:hypothetical protein